LSILDEESLDSGDELPGLYNASDLDEDYNDVIDYGICGNYIQAKWRDLLNASCWSKGRRSVITQSYNHSTTSDGYEIQVPFDATYYTEFLRRISTTSSIEVSLTSY